MFNVCLTGKTAGHDRPRHPVLQILWGGIHRSNIDYAKRIWEEFVQSIQTFLTDKKSLTTATCGKKKSVGKDGREIFGMLIPNALLTDAIKKAPYYGKYLENVAKYQQYLDEEHSKAAKQTKPSTPKATKVIKPAGDEAPKHSSSQPPTSTPAPTESSKKDQGKKHKLVKETSNAPSPAKRSKAGVPHKEPAYDDEEEKLQRALELSLKDQGEQVQGNGKEKVIEEQAARDLLTIQYIFQRRTPTTTRPFGNVESPSLDAKLAHADSEIESDEIVTLVNKEKDASNRELTEIDVGVQDEGQAGSNPGKQDEGQAGSNLGNAVEFQP
ncbi:retrovirus-related pol polyprotein from transposon TNT 1-94 [Tanacetum coccineum]